VARNTLAAYNADHPLFAVCPWILNGLWEWPDNGWIGGPFSEVVDLDTGNPYGSEKPVVKLLQANPPGPTPEPEPEPPAPVGELWGQVLEEVQGIAALLRGST
jgi:hypothetical protein